MNKGLNRFAILVACATFCLIISGALVTSHDAGLATPDWPLSNGQFFPKMFGNLFWEHGHRLVRRRDFRLDPDLGFKFLPACFTEVFE